MHSESLDVRCFCKRTPLLAVCGKDTISGQPYVHIKTWRQQRILAEVVVESGVARIRCRECLRWHCIRIRTSTLDTSVESLPETIEL